MLIEQNFDVSYTLEGETLDESPFVFTIPYVSGTAKVAVKHEGITLAEKVASPHTPAVTVLSPNGGEQLRGGSITVSWSASDGDSDALSIHSAVQFERRRELGTDRRRFIGYFDNLVGRWTTSLVRIQGQSCRHRWIQHGLRYL